MATVVWMKNTILKRGWWKKQWRDVRGWWRQYWVAELAGTSIVIVIALMAYAGAWTPLILGWALNIGENMGFYGTVFLMKFRRHELDAPGKPYLRRTYWSLRDMWVEFIGAEAVDFFFVRPWLIALIRWWEAENSLWGIVAAKLAADAVFLILSLVGYRVREHFWPSKERKQGGQKPPANPQMYSGATDGDTVASRTKQAEHDALLRAAGDGTAL